MDIIIVVVWSLDLSVWHAVPRRVGAILQARADLGTQ